MKYLSIALCVLLVVGAIMAQPLEKSQMNEVVSGADGRQVIYILRTVVVFRNIL